MPDPRGAPCSICTEPVLGSHLYHEKKGVYTHCSCSGRPSRDDFMKTFGVRVIRATSTNDSFGWVGIAMGGRNG